MTDSLRDIQLQPVEVDFVRRRLTSGARALRFGNRLDNLFSDHYRESFLQTNRFYGVIGAMMLMLFSLADREVVPNLYEGLLLLRLMEGALVIAVVAFATHPKLRPHFQAVMVVMVLILHLSILTVSYLAAGEGEFHYQTGSFLPVMFLGTVMRLQLTYMLPGAAVMWLCQMIAVYGLMSLPPSQETELLFLYTFVTFISLFVCYRVEFEGRQMFLQTLLLYHDQRQLLETQEELKALSYIDGLTQVANRRRFNQRLSEDWRRCLRAGKPLSLILLDVDNFKRLNDSRGHLAGDECLSRVAACLKSLVGRSSDLVCRYGGEEFAILLPETPLDAAGQLASAMVEAVALQKLPGATDSQSVVTVSAGVASLVPTEALRENDLIDTADGALYEAKHNGENQMKCAAR